MNEKEKVRLLQESEKKFKEASNSFNWSDYEKAIEGFSRVLEIARDFDAYNANAALNRGMCWMMLEVYEKAVEDFDSIDIKIGQLPPMAQVLRWTNLGFSYFKLGEIEKAKDCYKKVLELDPNDSDALTMLSQLK